MAQQIDVPGMGVIEFPDGMSDQDIVSAIQKLQKPQEQAPLAKLEGAIRSRLPDVVNKAIDVVGQPASGVLEGVAGMVNMPADIARAGGEAMGISPQYLPKSTEELKQIGMEQGITAQPPTSAGGRIARRVGQEVGAGLTAAVPILKAADVGAKGVAGFRGAIQAAATDPLKYATGEITASAGAGAGAGVAKEVAPDSKAAEITGMLVGSMVPAAVPGTVRYLLRGGEASRQAMVKNMQQFSEAGIEPTVGMATGRYVNQQIESGLAILPSSSGRMAVYAEQTSQRLRDNVDNVTAGLSKLRSSDAAGTAIQKGIKGWVSNVKSRWRSLDSQVAKYVQPGDKVALRNTRAVMADMADPVNAAAFPQIAAIAKRLDDVSQTGQIAYQDLRTIRSAVGGLIPESYAASLPQGQLKKLYAALSTDLRDHLAQNPAALKAFERSNSYYSAAMKRLDESLAPVTASDIPERVYMALERSGHAGRTVINAVKRSIGKDNWDVVAATVFQRMGRAPAGAQTAAVDAFSAGTFLTNWAKYAQNKGTMESLLHGTSGGTQFVHDMNAVAKVAEKMREAGRVFNNPSGTARAIANIGLGTGILNTVLLGYPVAAAATIGTAVLANMSARAFTNPKFVRFLAKSSQLPIERLPTLTARLGASLANEPEDVQVEIANYLSMLSDQFSQQSAAKGDR